ncbi:glutamate 5-kinase [Parerythrobacter jejuensis]|uniref:Glutamate 5-kinase n=1 Tax=Parerythrobacter jejuensis TaxID=795812 RepID=A0A845AQC6_9SPHN|nr:glutamate 5-kinase [Parerythrobacter jejuensis]MXP31659.1 glutamate 5-kinase [Parerythrobacter jejuensis]
MAIRTLNDLQDKTACPLLVVKLGSALLVDGGGQIRQDWLDGLIETLAGLHQAGQRIVLVSSGAIALGAARLRLPVGGRGSLSDAQAAASVGQIALAGLWSEGFARHDIVTAQMLLTLDDLEDRRRYLNASATLGRLLDAGAVPVINENDSVATEEIRFGDNDRLAARVAQAAGAQAVLLLSDVDGLFDRHPDEDGASLLSVVDTIDSSIRTMASDGSGSGLGSGGMVSKIQAAEMATRAGVALAIANGTADHPIKRVFNEGIGTLFLAQEPNSARKGWLGGRLAPAGSLRVDKGCAQALRDGASLLAAGIIGVSGAFQRGDLVTICDMGGRKLAQGLSEYAVDECLAIAGKRAADQADILGYSPRATVIHRDHMVML